MKVRRAKNILTNIKKRKIITNKGKHSCKPKAIEKQEDTTEILKPTEGAKEVKNVSEESGVTLSSLSEGKMADIRNEVEQMIKESKSDAECLS